ncbi:hypothetical protein HPB52_009992 [Rhipicephalus sanguineus]|uniref:Uncharacterized protein n=1 Tax=Rhipicephalus sanguineus TaxID=34632 RepID=A0A9D4SP19_RHISA|nr:hypothetical protein HPB52_009992 [Rhipicephalus sanguineus]
MRCRNSLEGRRFIDVNKAKHGRTLKLKHKSQRSQLTRLINDIEAAFTRDSVTEEQLCILNGRLNQLYADLRATGSDIVPQLSTTEADAEFDRVLNYHDRATATSAKLKYRIRQLQEPRNLATPAASTERVHPGTEGEH